MKEKYKGRENTGLLAPFILPQFKHDDKKIKRDN